MCNPASFVLTAGDVYWSAVTESHTAIREEFKAPEMVLTPEMPYCDIAQLVRERLSTRALCITYEHRINTLSTEMLPPDGDYTLPFYHWRLSVDQDLQPHWISEYQWNAYRAYRIPPANIGQRCQAALPAWGAERVNVALGPRDVSLQGSAIVLNSPARVARLLDEIVVWRHVEIWRAGGMDATLICPRTALQQALGGNLQLPAYDGEKMPEVEFGQVLCALGKEGG